MANIYLGLQPDVSLTNEVFSTDGRLQLPEELISRDMNALNDIRPVIDGDPTLAIENNFTAPNIPQTSLTSSHPGGAAAGEVLVGSVSINDVSITEGDSGTKTLTFTVTRTCGNAAFSVNYATANGTATAGSDYLASSGMLHFGVNVYTQTISITISGDITFEGDETFFVNLSGAANGASISDSQGQGTILNDDQEPQADLVVSSPSASKNIFYLDRDGDLDFTTNFTVQNNGNATAAATTAGVYWSTDSTITTADTLLYSVSVPSLAAGATSAQGGSLTAPGVGSGTYYIGVIADETGAVTESDEGNNATTGTPVTVQVLFTSGDDIVTLPVSGSWHAHNGNDSVTGTASADTIYGEGGSDTLDGAGGNDTLIGGIGDDAYFVDSSFDQVIENANEGADAVYASATYQLRANVEHLYLQGTADISGYGNSLANYIVGNSGNNTLDGQGGADTMAGGNGIDVYIVDNSFDVVIESANEGTDAVYSIVSYQLGSNVEYLYLMGIGDIDGVGNSADNYIQGNSGNNIINGGAGSDAMFGGSGMDVYFVDNSFDQVIENANEGADVVYSTASYQLGDNVEYLYLNGSANINGFGNSVNNYIQGNSGNNSIDGGAGSDTMVGGAGNDAYFVDSSFDRVIENANEGTDVVYSTVSYQLDDNVEYLYLNGTANINGFGNSAINYIQGNSGNNAIDGGGGPDAMLGGGGSDTFVFRPGQANGDLVYDFDGAGAAVGDFLQFAGYGPGATFTNIDATHWQVNYNNNTQHDVITFANAAAIHSSDFYFT